MRIYFCAKAVKKLKASDSKKLEQCTTVAYGVGTWDRNRHMCMLVTASQKRIYIQFVSGRNKCMQGSSLMLCCGSMQSCVIHNSFASYDGMSFALIAQAELIFSDPEHWVIWSQRAGFNFPFLRGKESNNLVFLRNHIIFNSFVLVM